MANPLHELSIAEAGRALHAGTLSSVALTQHALARIASLDPLLHSFVLVTKERALADADRALFQSLRDNAPPHVIIREIDAHINDPAFADALADALLPLLSS